MASRFQFLKLITKRHPQKILGDKKLLLKNTIATCTLLGLADSLQQWISRDYAFSQDKPLDIARTRRFATMGIVMGPMSHFWYKWLENKVTHGSKIAIVMKKIILDVIVAPAFGSIFDLLFWRVIQCMVPPMNIVGNFLEYSRWMFVYGHQHN